MNNVAAGPLAYDIMEKVAKDMGYHGINPEFLDDMGDFVMRGDFSGAVGRTDLAPSDIELAYRKVMSDVRAMFAPAESI
jgi:hypothetical protein